MPRNLVVFTGKKGRLSLPFFLLKPVGKYDKIGASISGEEKMKITVLDFGSVDKGDISPRRLFSLGEVKLYQDVPKKPLAELIGADCEALLCNKIPVTRELICSLPHLKYIGVMATGVNNIDLPACRERGITVCNIPGYSTDAVAQLTFSFILQFATRLMDYTASTERGDWVKSKSFSYAPYPMMELSGKTLGIFGLGAIGSRVAEIGSAFGMNILYTARTEKRVPYEKVTSEELFCRSDFLTLHTPLVPETERIVCERTLSLMKTRAFLINTARGALVDEAALAEALRQGKLAGYAADVLTHEPQRESDPLRHAPNCLLTPHIAWAPVETRKRLFNILCDNLERYIGGSPKNIV